MKRKLEFCQPHHRCIVTNEVFFPKEELQADTRIGTKQLAVCFKTLLVISAFLNESFIHCLCWEELLERTSLRLQKQYSIFTTLTCTVCFAGWVKHLKSAAVFVIPTLCRSLRAKIYANSTKKTQHKDV